MAIRPGSNRKFHPGVIVPGALTAMALLISGCSSSSGSAGTAGTSANGGGASTAKVSEACAFAEQASEPVKFEAPGPAVSGSALKGKSIWMIQLSAASPSIKSYTESTKAVATALGAKVTTYDTKGSSASAITGIRQAIAQGADVIVDVALAPELLTQPLKDAQAKGIITLDYNNSGADAPKPPGIDGRISWNYHDGGKARIASAICDTKGELNLGLITSSNVNVSKDQLDGFKEGIAAWCPDTCKMTLADVQTAKWPTDVQSTSANLIQGNPNLNYFMTQFDPMLVFALPAVKRLNTNGKLKVNGFNLNYDLFSQLKAGELQSDVGVSYPWQGYATIDQALRLLNKTDSVVVKIPYRLVTTKLANDLGLDSKEGLEEGSLKIFGDSFISGFNELWGVK